MSSYNLKTSLQNLKLSDKVGAGGSQISSPRDQHSKKTEVLRQSKSNDELRNVPWKNVPISLKVDTRVVTNKPTETASSVTKQSKGNVGEKTATTGVTINTGLLSDAIDLENLNESLLEFINGKLENFVSSMKQFVNFSERVAKFVHQKGPDVDFVMKNFQSQKTTVLTRISQMESNIQRLNQENKTRNMNISQFLQKTHGFQNIKDELKKNLRTATDKSEESARSNEGNLNDTIISLIEESARTGRLDTIEEIQRLKSMIKSIEEKNNLLLNRFDSSSPKHFMPDSYNPKRQLLTQQSSPKAAEAHFWSPQRPHYTSNTDPTLMLNARTIETQPDMGFNSPTKSRAYANKLNISDQGLRPQSEGHQVQQGVGVKRNSFKGNDEPLEELKRFFETRDTALLKDFDDIVGNARAKINSLGSDFNNIIEARNVRRDESGQQRIDHSMAYLKNFVRERLEGISRSITRMSNLTKKTLGDSINKENSGLLDISQTNIAKILKVNPNEISQGDIKSANSSFNPEQNSGLPYRPFVPPNFYKGKDSKPPVGKSEYQLGSIVYRKKPENQQSARELAVPGMKNLGVNRSSQELSASNPISEIDNRAKFFEQEETETTKAKYKTLEDDYKVLREKNKSLERLYTEKVQTMTHALEELKAQNSLLMDKLAKQHDEMNQEIENLTRKLEKTMLENAALRQRRGDVIISPPRQAMQERLDTYEALIEDLQRQNNAALEEKDELVAEVERLQKEIRANQRKNEYLLRDDREVIEPQRKAQDEKQKRAGHVLPIEPEFEQDKEEKLEHQEEPEAVHQQNEEAITELKEIKDKLDSKTQEYDELKKEIEERNNQITTLEEEVREKDQDYQKLYEEYSKGLEQLEEANQAKHAYKQEAEKAEAILDEQNELQKKLDETMQERVRLEEALEQLQIVLKERRSEEHEGMTKEILDKWKKTINVEVNAGLDKFGEDLERTNGQFDELEDKLVRCQETLEIARNEGVSSWKNRAIEAERELEEANGAFNEVTKEKEDLEQRLSEITNELEQKEVKYQDSCVELQQYEREMDNLKELFGQTSDNNQHLTEERDSLLAKITNFKASQDQFDSELTEARENIKNLSEDKTKLEARCSQISELEETLQVIRNTVEEKDNQLNELQKDYADMMSQITQNLNITIHKLTLLLDESYQEEQEQDLSLEEAFPAIEGLINQLRDQSAQRSNQILEEQKKYEGWLAEKEEQLEKLISELNNKEQVLADSMATSELFTNETNIQEKKLQEFSGNVDQRLSEQESRLEALKDNLEKLRNAKDSELIGLNEKLETKENETNDLVAKLNTLETDKASIESELTQKIYDSERKREDLQQEIEVLTKRNAELESTASEYEERLKQQTKETKVLLEQQSAALGELQTEVEKLNEDSDGLKKMLEETVSKRDAVAKENEELRTANGELEASVEELKQLKEKQEFEIVRLSDEVDHGRKQNEEYLVMENELREEINDKNNDLEILKKELASLDEKNKELVDRVEELEAKVSEFEKQRKATEERLENDKENHTTVIEKLEEERVKEIENLHNEYNEKISTLETNISQLEQEKNELQVRLEEQVETLQVLGQKTRKQFEDKLRKREDELQQLRERIETTESEYKGLTEKLNEEINDLREESQFNQASQAKVIAELNEELTVLRTEHQETIDSHQAVKTEHHEAQTRVDEEIQELKQLIREKELQLKQSESVRKGVEIELKEKEEMLHWVQEESKVTENERKEGLQTLENQLREKEHELQRIKEELATNNEQSKEAETKLMEELQKIKEKIESKEKTNDELVKKLEEEMKVKDEELESIQDSQAIRDKAYQQRIKKLEDKIKNNEEEIAKMQETEQANSEKFADEIREFESILFKLREESEATQKEKEGVIEELRRELQEKKEEIHGMEEENKAKDASQAGDLAKLEEVLLGIREEHNSKEENSQKMIKKLQEEVERLKQENQIEAEEYDEARRSLEQDFASIQQKSLEKERTAIGVQSELHEEINVLKESLEEKEKTQEELNSGLIRLRQDLKDAILALEEANEEKKLMQEALAERESAIEEATGKLNTAEEKLKDETEKNKNLEELSKAKNELNIKNEELCKLQEEITIKEKSIEGFETLVQKIEEENRQAQVTFNNLKTSLKEREKTIEGLKADMEKNSHKMAYLQQKYGKLKQEKILLGEQLEAKTAIVKTLETNIERLTQENQTFKSSSTDRETSLASLQKAAQEEKAELEAIIETKEHKINELKMVSNDTEAHLNQVQAEYLELQHTYKSSLETAETERTKYNNEIQQTKQEKESLEKEVEETKIFINNLETRERTTLAAYKEAQVELHAKDHEINNRKQEIAQVRQDFELQLKSSSTEQEENIMTIRKALQEEKIALEAEFRTLIETKENEINRLDKEAHETESELKSQIVELQEDIVSLKKLSEEEKASLQADLQTTIEAKENCINERNQEIVKIEAQLNQLQNEYLELQNNHKTTLENGTSERTILESEISQIRQEKESLAKDLEESKIFIENLETRERSALATYKEAQKELHARETEIANLKQEISQIQQDFELQLKSSSTEQETHISSIRKALQDEKAALEEEFRTAISAKEKELDELRQETSEAESELKSALAQLQEDIISLKKLSEEEKTSLQTDHQTIVQTKENHINDLKGEIKQFEGQISRLQNEYLDLQHVHKENLETHASEKTRLESVIRQITQEKASLEKELEETKVFIENLETRERSTLATYKEAQKELHARETEVTDLRQEIAQVKQDFELQLKSSSTEQETYIVSIRKDLHEEKAKLEANLQGVIESKESHINDLKKEAQDMEAQLNQLQSEYLELQNTYKQTLEVTGSERNKLDNEVSQLIKEKESLERELEETRLFVANLETKERSSLTAYKETQVELQAKEEKIVNLEQQLIQNQQEFGLQLKVKEEEMDEFKKEAMETESELKSALAQLQEDIISLKRLSEEEKTSLQADLQTIVETKENHISELKKEVAQFETQLSQLQTEHLELQNTHKRNIETATSERKRIEDEIDQVKREKEILEKELEESKIFIENLETRERSTLATYKEAQKELNARETEIANLKQEIAQIQQDFELQLKSSSTEQETNISSIRRALQDEKAALEEELRAAISAKEKEIDELRHETSETESELKAALAQLQEDIISLKKLSEEEKISLHADHQSIFETKENHISELKKEITQFEAQLTQLQNEYLELQNSHKVNIETAVSERKRIEDEISQVKREKETLEKELEETKIFVENLEARERSALTTYKETQKELHARETEIAHLKQEIAQIQQDFELQLKSSSSEQETYISTIRLTLQEEKTKLEADLKAIIEAKVTELASLKQENAESQQAYEAQLQSTIEEQTSLQKALQEEKAAIEADLQAIITAKENYINELKKEALATEAQLNQMQNEYLELQHTYKSAFEATASEKTRLDTNITNLNQDKEKLKKELEETKVFIDNLETRERGTLAVYKEAEQHRSELTKDLQKKSEEISRLQEKKEELEAKLSESQEMVKKLDADVRKLEKESYGLEKNSEIYIKQIQELKEIEDKLKHIEKDLEAKVKTLTESVETMKGHIQNRENALEKLEHDFEEYKKQQHGTSEEKSRAFETLQATNNSLETQLKSLHENHVSLENELKNKTQEASDKTSQITQLASELETERQNSTKENHENAIKIQSLIDEKAELETLKEGLENQLEQLQKSNDQYKTSLENLQNNNKEKFKKLEEVLQEVELEKQNLAKELHQEKERLTTITSELHDKEAVSKSLQIEVQELQDLLKQTRENLHSKEAEAASKTKEANDLQEALKQIDSVRSANQEKISFLSEELDNYKKTLEERIREAAVLKEEVGRLTSETERLYTEKSSLLKALEGLKDSTSSGNKTLISKYEEIIEMNKRTIEEKDRNANDIRREVDTVKMMLASKEREFEGRTNELRYQIDQLTQKNDHLQKDYLQAKQDLTTKTEELYKSQNRLKPLMAIADTLVDYSKKSLEDPDVAIDTLKERVKKLIIKESKFDIHIAESEEAGASASELNRVVEQQKDQIKTLQNTVEKHLKFLNLEGSRQMLGELVSTVNTEGLSERSRITLEKMVQEDMERNLVIEMRMQYGGQKWCLVTNQNIEKSRRKYIIVNEEELESTPLRNKINNVEVTNLENPQGTYKVSEEVQFVLGEISRQEAAINQKFEQMLAIKMDTTVIRPLQDLVAVNKNLLARVDVIIKRDMKDEEILRILQEATKESDGIRQRCQDLEEEKEKLNNEIKRLSEKKVKRADTLDISPVMRGNPKFVIEENKTISDIADNENNPNQSLSVQKSLNHLDDIFVGSPTSNFYNEDTIKALETRVEELSSTQNRITMENTELKRTLELSHRTIKENESLRHANSQFQIEYERLVEELQDRENDEQRFSLQIGILKKELSETQAKLAQSQSTQEKEHLRKILVKFLDNVLKGENAKETPELLKILCSLVFCSDTERNNLLTLLGKLQAQKKQGGGLLKQLF